MNIIAAIDENNGIGKNNALLTHIPDDMKFFKEKTTNNIVIMGRKTLESFPNQKALPNRINIVISSQILNIDNAICVRSINEAIDVANRIGKEIFIIGGASIYKQFIDKCDTLYITKIYKNFDADTFFPMINNDWNKEKLSDVKEYNGTQYQFLKYTK